MNINLHIERIVLSGMDVPSGMQEHICWLVSDQLTGLLSHITLNSDATIHYPEVATLRLTRINDSPAVSKFSTQLASSIYGSVSGHLVAARQE